MKEKRKVEVNKRLFVYFSVRTSSTTKHILALASEAARRRAAIRHPAGGQTQLQRGNNRNS